MRITVNGSGQGRHQGMVLQPKTEKRILLLNTVFYSLSPSATPIEISEPEAPIFPAVNQSVFTSTQNQAFNALVLLQHAGA